MTRTTAFALSAVVGIAAVPAVASTSQQGVARFQVPDNHGRYRSSSTTHTAFLLPTGTWKQVHGAMSGVLVPGAYRRTVVVRGNTCAVVLQATGRAQSARPNLTAPLGFPISVKESGTTGDLHWITGHLGGRVGGLDVAYAYQPTPRGLAPASKRWTFFWVDLRNHKGASIPKCQRLKARTSLRNTIEHIRLAKGVLQATARQ